jgi:hypothetical protein
MNQVRQGMIWFDEVNNVCVASKISERVADGLKLWTHLNPFILYIVNVGMPCPATCVTVWSRISLLQRTPSIICEHCNSEQDSIREYDALRN